VRRVEKRQWKKKPIFYLLTKLYPPAPTTNSQHMHVWQTDKTADARSQEGMVAALLATSSAFVAGYQVVGSRVAEVQGSRVAAPARTPTMVVADKWSQKQRDASRYASFAFAPEGLDLDSDEGFTYEELAASMGDIKKYARGDSATGTVVSFEPNGAVVDIGVKSSAYCSLTEMALTKPDKPEFVFSIGDTCEFVVMSREDENGQLFLSRRRILFQEAWDKVPPPSPSLSACPVLPPAHPPPLLTPLTPHSPPSQRCPGRPSASAPLDPPPPKAPPHRLRPSRAGDCRAQRGRRGGSRGHGGQQGRCHAAG
jgi:hypothetical protein